MGLHGLEQGYLYFTLLYFTLKDEVQRRGLSHHKSDAVKEVEMEIMVFAILRRVIWWIVTKLTRIGPTSWAILQMEVLKYLDTQTT
jgi:hypothetical protein